jgi:hypothetical protein
VAIFAFYSPFEILHGGREFVKGIGKT